MIMAIYKKALNVLLQKPIKLWGISLLYGLLSLVLPALCGIAIPVLGLGVGLLLETSMTMVYLHGYRGEDVRTTNLFECFKDWQTIKRVLCGMGWMMLWIFLWTLIPIVGIVFGIIRTYQYRLTPYILVMEPDVKPTEAIKLSKERTQGWKGKMFGADILVIVAFYVVFLILTLLGRIPYVGFIFIIIMVLFCLAFALFGGLFLGLVQAAFYEEIRTWGSYPGRGAYAAPKQPRQPKGPAGNYPPQGYDPSQGYPPQGYAPYGQQPGYPPQQYAPQQPYGQQPGAYPPPQQPYYAPPQGYDPYAQPQPGYPAPPVPQQPAAPEVPQQPAAPDVPQQPAAPEVPQQPAAPEAPQEPPQA